MLVPYGAQIPRSKTMIFEGAQEDFGTLSFLGFFFLAFCLLVCWCARPPPARCPNPPVTWGLDLSRPLLGQWDSRTPSLLAPLSASPPSFSRSVPFSRDLSHGLPLAREMLLDL